MEKTVLIDVLVKAQKDLQDAEDWLRRMASKEDPYYTLVIGKITTIEMTLFDLRHDLHEEDFII